MKCPSCNGEGHHFTGVEHTGMQQTQLCSDCEGTGLTSIMCKESGTKENQQLREELEEVKQKHKLLNVLYQQQQDMYEKELSRLRQEKRKNLSEVK